MDIENLEVSHFRTSSTSPLFLPLTDIFAVLQTFLYLTKWMSTQRPLVPSRGEIEFLITATDWQMAVRRDNVISITLRQNY